MYTHTHVSHDYYTFIRTSGDTDASGFRYWDALTSVTCASNPRKAFSNGFYEHADAVPCDASARSGRSTEPTTTPACGPTLNSTPSLLWAAGTLQYSVGARSECMISLQGSVCLFVYAPRFNHPSVHPLILHSLGKHSGWYQGQQKWSRSHPYNVKIVTGLIITKSLTSVRACKRASIPVCSMSSDLKNN